MARRQVEEEERAELQRKRARLNSGFAGAFSSAMAERQKQQALEAKAAAKAAQVEEVEVRGAWGVKLLRASSSLVPPLTICRTTGPISWVSICCFGLPAIAVAVAVFI